ncbi:MAG: hypothetical protein ACTSPP_09480 [Candidatus Heimdallarchaeaceae archaeon]
MHEFPEDYVQDTSFYEEAKKEYVPMSDGAELLHYYTNKNKDYTIFFVPGFNTGPFSWNDLWSHLYKDYNLYVQEKREMKSAKVKWGHKANMDRLSLDVKEAMDYLDLDEKKTFLMGPCIGASIISHAVATKKIEPLGVILNGPPKKFFLPKALLPLAYVLPAFFMGIIGKPLLVIWLNLSMPKGKQRDIYISNIRNATGMRWKKFLAVAWHDSFVDYPHVNCPALITGATEDRMHEAVIAKQVAEMIPKGEYVDTPSYYFAHYNPGAKEYAQIVKDFIEKIISIAN